MNITMHFTISIHANNQDTQDETKDAGEPSDFLEMTEVSPDHFAYLPAE